jgi:hypothetical protein
MGATGQRGPVRFVLELTPTEHGRVEGVLVHEGSDEPQRFSGWLDLLRLLEKAAHVTEASQRTLAKGDTGGNDDDAAGGQGHGVVGLNEPRGPPSLKCTVSTRADCGSAGGIDFRANDRACGAPRYEPVMPPLFAPGGRPGCRFRVHFLNYPHRTTVVRHHSMHRCLAACASRPFIRRPAPSDPAWAITTNQFVVSDLR